MTPGTDRALNRIAAAGLVVGAVFGLAGTLVASPHVQATLWAIDSVALVVATSLLTRRLPRTARLSTDFRRSDAGDRSAELDGSERRALSVG
jgi:hypothetical protein